jgi:hypothetical protein
MVEAESSYALKQAFHGDSERAVQVITLRKSVGLLRCGALPVAVIEGPIVPVNKILIKANRAAAAAAGAGGVSEQERISNGKSAREWMRKKAVRLMVPVFEALGIPVVYAKGEAEQTCAELNRRGLVDGCDSKDADSLLFGAKCVLSGIKLPGNMRESEMKVCRIEKIREKLGFGRFGLIAMASLMGNDFSDGAHGYGLANSFFLINWLIKSRGIPEGEWIFEDIALFKDPGFYFKDEEYLMTLKRCTKKQSSESEEISGTRDCCEYHINHDKIKIIRVIQKMRMVPDFFESIKDSVPTFDFFPEGHERFPVESNLNISDLNALSDRFKWIRRPDVEKIIAAVPIKRNLLLSNVIPVLMLWDTLQLWNYPKIGFRKWSGSGDLPIPSTSLLWFKRRDIEFIPTHIRKSAASEAKSRYLIKWQIRSDTAYYDEFSALLEKLPTPLTTLPKKVIELCCPLMEEKFKISLEKSKPAKDAVAKSKSKKTKSLANNDIDFKYTQLRIDDLFRSSKSVQKSENTISKKSS